MLVLVFAACLYYCLRQDHSCFFSSVNELTVCAAEYVFDNSWASSYHRTGQSYYPKLQVGVAAVKALLKPEKTVCKPEKIGCGHTAPLPVV